MDYASFLIRKKRLEKNWSQEGLCSGICTVSYLSKIEQGKANASEEVLRLLFARLGLCWNGKDQPADKQQIEEAYELLFSAEFELLHKMQESEAWAVYENSIWGLDWLLLSRSVSNGKPLEKTLETLMDSRQLALQRILQGRNEEAMRQYPCGYTCLAAGNGCYVSGNWAQAVEYLNRANTLAAEEGRPLIMLSSRMISGCCYCNVQNLDSMERHYCAARRLARSLGLQEELAAIEYNVAAACIEAGQYAQALNYFETRKETGSRLDLHKLAICYEKLNRKEEALEVLGRAQSLPDNSPERVESEMCQTVQLRLTDPCYLDSECYGDSLKRTFALCRRWKPAGFCLFHMPWMIEWYEHRRQYKQVALLLSEFPAYRKNTELNVQ